MTIECDSDGYAIPPRHNPEIADCMFYHTIELPGLGVQHGQWDLRPNIENYLGATDFRNRRVLEIGVANGFVSFELERRGAHVVGFDLNENSTYDAPPSSEKNRGAQDWLMLRLRQVHNAFWLAHNLLGSRAKMAYGHANNLPGFLGRFDIGVIANVLQHLRDPVGAIMQLALICDTIVITETDWMAGYHDDLRGMIMFDSDAAYSWYQVKPPLIEAVLSRMGFGRFQRTFHKQFFIHDATGADRGMDVPHFTITAEIIDRSRRV